VISADELSNGIPFILQLRNSAGVAFQWMETLRGEVARHWYNIYQSSDWESLRAEAAGVFRFSVTGEQMQAFFKSNVRCISIQPMQVKVEELQNVPQPAPVGGKP